MKIHHTITKKAEKNGLTIEVEGKTVKFLGEGGTIYNIAKDPKEGLVVALKNLEAGTPFQVENGAMVKPKYRDLYKQYSDSCGDDMACALKDATVRVEKTKRGKDREVMDEGSLAKIAKNNGIDVSKYDHLNPGQTRMNVGNRLRGMLRKGEAVTVGQEKFDPADYAP